MMKLIIIFGLFALTASEEAVKAVPVEEDESLIGLDSYAVSDESRRLKRSSSRG